MCASAHAQVHTGEYKMFSNIFQNVLKMFEETKNIY